MHARDEQDREELFHRINNAFVRRLTLSFYRAELLYLDYLRANANNLQCQIRRLHIEDSGKDIDYALLDFLGVHLKPQIYEATILFAHREDIIMLFTRTALRDTVRHVVYWV